MNGFLSGGEYFHYRFIRHKYLHCQTQALVWFVQQEISPHPHADSLQEVGLVWEPQSQIVMGSSCYLALFLCYHGSFYYTPLQLLLHDSSEGSPQESPQEQSLDAVTKSFKVNTHFSQITIMLFIQNEQENFKLCLHAGFPIIQRNQLYRYKKSIQCLCSLCKYLITIYIIIITMSKN